MKLRCTGPRDNPHEETGWSADTWEDLECWYCGEEGCDMNTGRYASLHSPAMRKPEVKVDLELYT